MELDRINIIPKKIVNVEIIKRKNLRLFIILYLFIPTPLVQSF